MKNIKIRIKATGELLDICEFSERYAKEFGWRRIDTIVQDVFDGCYYFLANTGEYRCVDLTRFEIVREETHIVIDPRVRTHTLSEEGIKNLKRPTMDGKQKLRLIDIEADIEVLKRKVHKLENRTIYCPYSDKNIKIGFGLD